MKIGLRTSGPARAWHRRLAERLEPAGHTLSLVPTTEAGRAMARVDVLLALEHRLHGICPALFEPVAPLPALGAGQTADLVLEPLFDGEAGEAALLQALMRGRAPLVTVRGRSDGDWRDLATGLPATERPTILAHALDQVLLRLVTLLVQAVGAAATNAAPAPVSSALDAPRRSAAAFLARGMTQRLVRRLGPARGRPDHWRIAYRPVGLAARGPWQAAGFRVLPEDGLRFQADPFAFDHGGRTYLFFEDFPYATRKGVIAVVEIDAAGQASSRRTVLEQPVHLSYPFVFTHAGAIYMLPETSGAGTIQLFRADPFPDRWTPDRILVDGVVAADATPILHQGRFWLFATLSDDGGSSWDQLGLFHADTLFGPWRPHPANPVLIDAGAARPAGAMWHDGSTLMRVAQDCRAGYGAGLAICRVDRLDREGYAQTVVERRAAPNGFGASGVHTLNRSASLEVIDLRLSHAAT